MRCLHPLVALGEVADDVRAAEAVLAPILPRVRRFVATASAGFGPDAHDPYGIYEDEAHCYGLDVADYWLGCTGVVRDRDFLDRYVRALSHGD